MARTTAAGKYISLYRKIRDQGMYLHASTSGAATAATTGHQQTVKGAALTVSSLGAVNSEGSSSTSSMRLGPDRKGAAGNSSSFNINSKLCSIRE